jgi:Flp pilus assembly protein TadG
MNLTKPRHKRRHRERGQALVEFALTAPILLTLLLGLIELGNGLNSYIKVVAVARDAARLGAQTCAGVTVTCDTKLRDLVAVEAGSLRGNESWVTASWVTGASTSGNICSGGNTPGMCITHFNSAASSNTNAVRVKVCYHHSLLVGLPGVVPNPLRMCSSSTMRVITP